MSAFHIVCIIAGICFGPIYGTIINWAGAVVANSIIFKIAEKTHLNFKGNKRGLVKFVSRFKYPQTGLTLILLIPAFPNFLIDYTASSLKLSLKNYLSAILVGTFPVALFYAIGGHAIFAMNLRMIIAVAVILLLLIFTYALIKRRIDHP